MRVRLWVLSLLLCPSVWAAPDTTLTVAPSCTSGTTILCADETSRNSSISTAYNAHSHTDISQVGNTLNVGDGTAGNKSVCANAADTTDSCLRWNDTVNLWTIDQPVASSFNAMVVSSGTGGLTNNALLIGTGTGNVIDDLILLAGSQPATYGDVSARVYNTSAQSITSGTATVVTFDSERYDTDTIHSTSSNTGRLTATTAGKYQIAGHIEWAADATVGLRRMEILLNGATVIAAQDCAVANEASPAFTTRCSLNTYYSLSATDYVELRVRQTVASTLNVAASGNYSPEFEMVKVP